METPKTETPKRSGCPDPQYIIVGYDQGYYDSLFIKDEDVVRPPNHKYTDKNMPSDWARKKSMAGCPTYGSCEICMMCGPVDESCIKCSGIARYRVLFSGRHIMDSIMLTGMADTGFL
jgi:hypothetical protein